jgi:hypothetical protein
MVGIICAGPVIVREARAQRRDASASPSDRCSRQVQRHILAGRKVDVGERSKRDGIVDEDR